MVYHKILHKTRSVSYRERYTIDEAVELIDQNDDLGDIHAADLEDTGK